MNTILYEGSSGSRSKSDGQRLKRYCEKSVTTACMVSLDGIRPTIFKTCFDVFAFDIDRCIALPH